MSFTNSPRLGEIAMITERPSRERDKETKFSPICIGETKEDFISFCFIEKQSSFTEFWENEYIAGSLVY